MSYEPHEKVNEALHIRIYNLLEQSFADAREIVIAKIVEYEEEENQAMPVNDSSEATEETPITSSLQTTPEL